MAYPQASLLGVPREIRDQIYDELLSSLDNVTVREKETETPSPAAEQDQRGATKPKGIRPNVWLHALRVGFKTPKWPSQPLESDEDSMNECVPFPPEETTKRTYRLREPLDLNILLVNHQLRDEALPVLCKALENARFAFELGPRSFVRFILAIPPPLRLSIRKALFTLPPLSPDQDPQLLARDAYQLPERLGPMAQFLARHLRLTEVALPMLIPPDKATDDAAYKLWERPYRAWHYDCGRMLKRGHIQKLRVLTHKKLVRARFRQELPFMPQLLRDRCGRFPWPDRLLGGPLLDVVDVEDDPSPHRYFWGIKRARSIISFCRREENLLAKIQRPPGIQTVGGASHGRVWIEFPA